MTSQDATYNAQIKPLLDQIFDICEQHDMDFVAAITINDTGDDNENGYYINALVGDDSPESLKIAMLVLTNQIPEIELTDQDLSEHNGAVH